MTDLFGTELSTGPVHKRAQRLRWFTKAFEDQVAETQVETGNRYAVSQSALAEVFSNWIEAFNAQKPDTAEARRDYVGFASGLMLRTLIERNPIQSVELAPNADDSQPIYFWPEGYVYVMFCLKTRGLVIEVDFNGHQELSPVLQDVRTWWSFRENIREDPSQAIAFLDLFAGDNPHWSMPSLFSARLGSKTGQDLTLSKTDRSGD